MKNYKKFGIRKPRKEVNLKTVIDEVALLRKEFIETTLKKLLCCKYKNKKGNKEKNYHYFMLLA